MKSIQWAIISFAFGLLNLVVGLKNILKIKADNILWNYIQFVLVNLIVLGFIVWGVITIVKIIKNKYK
jgi:type III secretory pathway component EscV